MRPSLWRRMVRWLALGMVPALVASAPVYAQRAAYDSTVVPVASRTLARGAVLEPSDITQDVRLIRRSLATPTSVTGWVTRRVVRAGEILMAPAITPPPTITIGQHVDFVVSRGGLELSLPATAMFSATLGDTVAVRLDTQRRATGIVAGPARVVALDPRTDK